MPALRPESMLEGEMDDQEEYIFVEAAREQLGISPAEMLMLLEAGALPARKDPRNETVRWVRAQEVKDAVEHLAHYRQKEQARIHWRANSASNDINPEPRDGLFFNLSDSDLMMLLLASISYFDAERDIYFRNEDNRDHIFNSLAAVEKLYLLLKMGIEEGRPVEEIIQEIYDQRPDQSARRTVFLYLMRKATRESKPS